MRIEIQQNREAGTVGIDAGDAPVRQLSPEQARDLAANLERKLDEGIVEDSLAARSTVHKIRRAADAVESGPPGG